ncbi:MAG: cytochrome (ubi)quinol oxidase subunit III [Cypionkella sp.]
MSAQNTDPQRVNAGSAEAPATTHGDRSTASKRIIVGYGFWIFLLSDIVMFSAFFAAYAVLKSAVADGPSGRDIFQMQSVAIQTALLLTSSFACGMVSLAANARRALWFHLAIVLTGLLGAGFLMLELREFAGLIHDGNGPQRSAFLSAFFALVGLHGLHVAAGLLWLGTLMAQVWAKGFRDDILRRVLCFTLFWHALDIIWIALFSTVYLMELRL